jgi:ketosteroid isomerase-like protein
VKLRAGRSTAGLRLLLAAAAGAAAGAAGGACAHSSGEAAPAAVVSPRAALDELLAADRAFSAASARTDLISGLRSMFADDVVMAVPGKPFASGAAEAVAALQSNPENARSRLTWAPIRGGISADGQHGFTFGYMTLQKPDSSRTPLKYLAYWVRQPEGWRVVAYRRGRRPEGAVSSEQMPPALPARAVAPSADSTAIAGYRESLDRAERSFSSDAQKIGLGPAFVQYGSADAINMGGSGDTAFVVGSEAIGRLVSEGGPATGSSVSWAPERVIVASSGDLGVTIGLIRPKEPAADGNNTVSFPFFTVWRRPSPSDPWRYVAE